MHDRWHPDVVPSSGCVPGAGQDAAGHGATGTERRRDQGFVEAWPPSAPARLPLPPAGVHSMGTEAAWNGKAYSLESAGLDAVFPGGGMVCGCMGKGAGGERAGQRHQHCQTVQSCLAGSVTAVAFVGHTLQFIEGTFLRLTADISSDNVWHRVAAGRNATRSPVACAGGHRPPRRGQAVTPGTSERLAAPPREGTSLSSSPRHAEQTMPWSE